MFSRRQNVRLRPQLIEEIDANIKFSELWVFTYLYSYLSVRVRQTFKK